MPRTVGLSPRGWGNRHYPAGRILQHGSIPAWAGEPPPTTPNPPLTGVYPRVGGGTCCIVVLYPRDHGLSPRGRGNLTFRTPGITGIGSIPAWAGEPGTRRSGLTLRWVYPRVGGGTITSQLPRLATMGLSPRGRGNREDTIQLIQSDRSIPAWAGEPITPLPADWTEMVYPRVGGGTGCSENGEQQKYGLSPRGRGNHPRTSESLGPAGSIPAWAGEPHHQRRY